jgi:hypothetical protein
MVWATNGRIAAGVSERRVTIACRARKAMAAGDANGLGGLHMRHQVKPERSKAATLN